MTTVPDSNVRPARRAAGESTRAAGRSVLARLLLFVRDQISKLDRKLLLLLVVSPMSACIIPAGPEFQDPPGGPNSAPFVWMESPDEGRTVVSATPTFSVTPGDNDLGDSIFVKWLTDFPPSVSTTVDVRVEELGPSTNGNPIRHASMFMPNCSQVSKVLSTHHITAAISDRSFDGRGFLTTTGTFPPALVIWTWEQNCPAQQ
jgi:hypothetical protein